MDEIIINITNPPAVEVTVNVSELGVDELLAQANDYTDTKTATKAEKVRVVSSATATSLALNLDLYDEAELTALASALTIANPTGTTWNGRIIAFVITDNGLARSISYGSDFVDLTGDAPSTTTVGKVTIIPARWRTSRAKWEIFGSITEA